MTASFKSDKQRRMFDAVTCELRAIGYSNELLVKDYRFGDWFLPDIPEREVPVAAFGQTPLSYESACFAVLLSNGKSGAELVSEFRALGAPHAFEIDNERIIKWSFGADEGRVDLEFNLEQLPSVFGEYADPWSRPEVLRAKNITTRHGQSYRQMDLFLDTGLIPALEDSIQSRLDPMLNSSLNAAIEAHESEIGTKPPADVLFQLAFRLLAGKVFFDRNVSQFTSLGNSPGPESVLSAVSQHYGTPPKSLLTNSVRQAMYDRLWTQVDFRNLSIEVLTLIWAETFITPEDRARLGIHRTKRTIAQYVVDRLPFEKVEPENRFVVEPCSGSATFLIAALHRMRDLLPPDMNVEDRHEYLRSHLFGFEREAFGIEIAWLCLTLADFPNPNGWHLFPHDVFDSERFEETLRSARFVLCNPPFEVFSDADRQKINPTSLSQPVELLTRTLSNLHPEGSLGFVLPHTAIDGRQYRQLRRNIACRFSDVGIVSLPPESAFETAKHPSLLLIASGQRSSSGATCSVNHRKVTRDGWKVFTHTFQPDREDSQTIDIESAENSFLIPDLSNVWEYLFSCDKLSTIASIHRGIEWNKPLTENWNETGWRELLIKDEPEEGYMLGIPPRANPFHAFEFPPTKYLCVKEEHRRRNAYDLPWEKPKVFINARRKSQHHWRLAAVADFDALLCYQNFIAIWPHKDHLTIALSAVLNGPVANAYLSTHSIKHNRNTTIKNIPVPTLNESQIFEIDNLVVDYQSSCSNSDRDMIIRRVDAAVLSAYDLPPRLERELLDFFNGSRRQTPFPFGDYYPEDFSPCFALREYLAEDFHRGTAKEFVENFDPPSPDILAGIRKATEMFGS